jgi:hypothetical protein
LSIRLNVVKVAAANFARFVETREKCEHEIALAICRLFLPLRALKMAVGGAWSGKPADHCDLTRFRAFARSCRAAISAPNASFSLAESALRIWLRL